MFNSLHNLEKFNGSLSLNGRNLDYFIQHPKIYDASNYPNKLPLLVFLHGTGGHTEIQNQMEDSNISFLTKGLTIRDDFPVFVLAPRLPEDEYNSHYSHSWLNCSKLILEAIDKVKSQFPIDEDRITLSGFSLGGYGTWAIGCKYPEYFSALVPINASLDIKELTKIRHVPTWVFHGAKDEVVYLWEAQRMINKLLSLNAPVSFTIHPGGHTLEDSIFNPSLIHWIEKQNRKNNSFFLNFLAEEDKKRANITESQTQYATSCLYPYTKEAWNNLEGTVLKTVVKGVPNTEGTFTAFYDETFLYFKISVFDCTPNWLINNKDRLFDSDSVEIFLDYSDSKGDIYNEHCMQLSISRDNRKQGTPNINPDLCTIMVIDDENAYEIIAIIPHPKGFIPHKGLYIGFDMAINDNVSGGGRETILSWCDATGEAWRYPYCFGTLKFL
jgi:predicted esterase